MTGYTAEVEITRRYLVWVDAANVEEAEDKIDNGDWEDEDGIETTDWMRVSRVEPNE